MTHTPARPRLPGSHHARHAVGLTLALLCSAAAVVSLTPRPVHAQAAVWAPGQLGQTIYQNDPHDDIRKLLRQGKYAQALILVERGAARNPRDPQMRFWQGFLYEQLGQTQAAKPVYQALIEEFPELPEPYNNLAVLSAADGDLGMARLLLEQALRANPNYATAHDNLGDVLVQLARQSYQRAAQLDPSLRDAQRKAQTLGSAASPAPTPK